MNLIHEFFSSHESFADYPTVHYRERYRVGSLALNITHRKYQNTSIMNYILDINFQKWHRQGTSFPQCIGWNYILDINFQKWHRQGTSFPQCIGWLLSSAIFLASDCSGYFYWMTIWFRIIYSHNRSLGNWQDKLVENDKYLTTVLVPKPVLFTSFKPQNIYRNIWGI